MFDKHIVEDRVNAAIQEGLESQQAARAQKGRPRRSGLFARLYARLSAFWPKKGEKTMRLSQQQREISQET